ncbi:MAG TPA: glycosyl transferase family 1 [Porphyromonadaceae bacterium]|jgi:glycosyltransferase involved in cell wall biosynthesis|nr:glycosyltransferase [Bacteroidales bacterium]HBC39480.1 glycosyl transferase family 1 [Porphyromonadaceae bacterium]HCB88070.1 glycosyl transferase family 1 [Porphyromonadaceae bacterium]
MPKKKMLIFHQVLATYRIDQFNLLNELFDLEVVYLYDSMQGLKINQKILEEQCNFRFSYFLRGIKYGDRVFRFGIYKKVRQAKPDIIMSYEYSLATQYLLLLRSLGLIHQQIGTMVDDSMDMCHNVQSKARELVRNRTVKRVDFLVVMSHEVARFYRYKFSLDEQQIIVSPIVQLTERLRKEPDRVEAYAQNHVEKHNLRGKKILLFVGRFVPAKALPLFLNNISSILQERVDTRLVLVGEGAEKEALNTIIKEKNIEDKVLFPGKYQAQELYGWYTSASGFVLPSLFEPFGAVVNEALIFGLPVLCSRLAGATCLINTENGLIFDPSDKEDTVQKLNSFMEKMKVVDDVSLTNKPPLIEDFRDDFRKEWKKLA